MLKRTMLRPQVDEFQDNSNMQFNVLCALAPTGCITVRAGCTAMRSSPGVCAYLRACMQVVGDMDQQIYGFNGSSPTLESAFREHYRDRDAISVRLDYNYRSPRNLVALADAFIQATLQRDQTVPPTAVEPNGRPLRIVECETEVHEQALLVKLVNEMRKSGVGALPACFDVRALHECCSWPRPFERTAGYEDVLILTRTRERVETIKVRCAPCTVF
jgi:superfamily I DNA/RNA helicase